MVIIITIKDVAKKAGVSISTVSLVLNGSNAVKYETRLKVMEAVKVLGYQPNQSARSLVTKQNKVIGVVKATDTTHDKAYSFDGVVDTYVSEMLRGIGTEIEKIGYSMLIDWCFGYGSKEELPPMVDKNKVDGVLFVGGYVSEELIEKVQEKGVPAVLVGTRSEKLDYVDTNPEFGIEIAVNHLVTNGHRKIAFVNGSDMVQSTARKLKGYKRALKGNGILFQDEMVENADFSGYGGYTAIQRIIERGGQPTAVIGGTDCIALGVLRFFHEKGIYCPKEVSVIGFEDSILSEYAVPALSSINIHKDRIGAEATRALLNRIQNPKAKKVRIVIEPDFVERKSVRLVEKDII